MPFNADKCKRLHVGHSYPSVNYSIGGVERKLRESGCSSQRIETLRFDESCGLVKSLDCFPLTKLKPHSFCSSPHFTNRRINIL